jgi:hypothetical protein
MTDPVSEAKADAQLARDRLQATIGRVQERLSPRNVARRAIGRAKAGIRAKAAGAVDAVNARPALTLGILAASALVLLRKPVIGVVKRLKKENENG